MILVIEQFLPDFDAARAAGLSAHYVDFDGHDGQVYKRVCLTDVPGVHQAIERAMGPIDMLGMGYRLNYDGELPNAAVHSDLGWGTHALVLFLADGPSGTAFWRHKATGALTIHVGQQALWKAVRDDWNDEGKWEQIRFVPMKANRALIYDSAQFHSRYPFAAFGDCPENGRMVAVAFFNLKDRAT